MTRKNTNRSAFLGFLLTAASIALVDAQVSYTGGTYSQNFDALGASGTTTTTLPGWTVDSIANTAATGTSTDSPALTGSVSSSSTALTGANDGTGATNGNYNFGSASSGERALGSTAASNLQRDTYVSITNNTGFSIAQFSISYDGEQWRLGQTGSAVNVLTLQYSLDGTSWVNMGTGFNFSSPVTMGSAGALNGNSAANRVAGIGGIYTPATPISNGTTFYVRWADPDDGGSDNGMGIDNFSFAVVPEPSTWAMMLAGAGLLGATQRLRRKRN